MEPERSPAAEPAPARTPPCVVLGAGGFLGTTICRHLRSRGHAVHAFGSRDFDLRDRPVTVERLGAVPAGAYLVFAAGRHRQRADDAATLIDNCRMVANVLEAATVARISGVCFLSSVEVYGYPAALPISESSPLDPLSPYGVGKLACEALVAQWARNAGASCHVLRLPGVYGPGDTSDGMICRALRAARSGGTFTLHGAGADTRDFVFSEDVARCVARAIAAWPRQLLVNIATGRSLPVATILDVIRTRFPDLAVGHGAAHGPTTHLVFDTSRLLQWIDFLPVSLEQGLARTMGEAP